MGSNQQKLVLISQKSKLFKQMLMLISKKNLTKLIQLKKYFKRKNHRFLEQVVMKIIISKQQGLKELFQIVKLKQKNKILMEKDKILNPNSSYLIQKISIKLKAQSLMQLIHRMCKCLIKILTRIIISWIQVLKIMNKMPLLEEIPQLNLEKLKVFNLKRLIQLFS